ncbi:RpiB/LacA/LacB family sugar-phosphate isomerase [Anaerophaga thermohalophila]|jgi:ribose 5-phosphate isomerase B|uniref:RpiB/LacA/LacB family sugar-phosphate isomerase n=1 Tax=Anaerophaga thermohalophila TaxID=177400 RepID=UPI0002E143CA|nr:RpiB/LacA/LacB family sugar-phosphate isomerase [Anaerophaga thermohalophila]
MNKELIGIASDHAGYEMKEMAKKYLEEKGYEVKDFGTNSSESSDYSDFAHPLGEAISNGKIKRAVAFCGSGNGINITLNRHKGVRSAYSWNPEIARLGRAHNDANVCAMPARFLEPAQVREIIDAFLSTDFEGGRHQKRIEKIEL